MKKLLVLTLLVSGLLGLCACYPDDPVTDNIYFQNLYVWDGANWNQITTNGGGIGAEVDPVFTASPSFGIAAGDITDWDTAFGWGNHASAGYLTAETNANSLIADDVATNATMYPVWVTANTGNLPLKVSSTKMTFNPSTGMLTATSGQFTLATSGTYNELTLTKQATGFTIAGGTISKTLTVTGDATISGTPLSNPMTTLGDIIYEDAVPAPNRLAGDTSNTRKFLRTLSVGGVAQAPAWDTIQAADVPTLNQNTSGTAAGLSAVLVPASGGTGIANNIASTLAISGNFATTLTVTGVTGVTLPTSGTLATLAGTEELDNKTLDSSVLKGTYTASGTVTFPAVTLGGAITGGSQTWSNVGDMTFTTAKSIKSGAVAGNTLFIQADDNAFITLTTGTPDTCVITGATLNNSIAQGTWTASGTWTLPAHTLGGTITGGSQTVNSLGSTGIGVASSANYKLNISSTWTDPATTQGGFYNIASAVATTGANAQNINGFYNVLYVPTANTQNWTGTTGLVASFNRVEIQSGATGTITWATGINGQVRNLSTAGAIVTNAVSFMAINPTATGSVVNAVGYYCPAITTGGTTNWGYYSVAASNYMAQLTMGGPLKHANNYATFLEMTAPGAGAANEARVYAVVDGGSLTDLAAVFQDGTVDIFAQETTPLDAPIFKFPSDTKVETYLRKEHPGLVKIVCRFTDGTEFVLKEIEYHDPEKIAANKGTENPLPGGWLVEDAAQRAARLEKEKQDAIDRSIKESSKIQEEK